MLHSVFVRSGAPPLHTETKSDWQEGSRERHEEKKQACKWKLSRLAKLSSSFLFIVQLIDLLIIMTGLHEACFMKLLQYNIISIIYYHNTNYSPMLHQNVISHPVCRQLSSCKRCNCVCVFVCVCVGRGCVISGHMSHTDWQGEQSGERGVRESGWEAESLYLCVCVFVCVCVCVRVCVLEREKVADETYLPGTLYG